MEFITTGGGHKVWYCGEDSKHQHGVAFIVREEYVGISRCTPISSRLSLIRISARLLNITVIQVYAPVSDLQDEEVEQFYEQLDSL